MAIAWAQDAPVEIDNVPFVISTCLKGKEVDVSKRINPFYLRGDIDGDRQVDYVVLVEEKTTKKKGVAFCLSSRPNTATVVGAGVAVRMEGGVSVNDLGDFDVWGVAPVPGKRQECLYLEKAAAGSGYMRWNGTKIVWIQAGI
jgi:hypothetical protein